MSRVDRHRRALTVGLVLTVTLVGFESLAVSTALPAITRELDGVGLYGWVFSAYMLGSLLGIVLAGRAADRHGPALPYLSGLALFAAALALAAVAPSMYVLVAARFLQGLGGGAIPAVAYVATGRGYPSEQQPRVFAIMSSAWVIPGVIGPSISAFVTDQFSWRWVFAGLLPIVVPAAFLTAPSLRRLGPPPKPVATPAAASEPNSTSAAVRVALGVALLLGATGGLPVWVAIPLALLGATMAVRAYIVLTPPGTLRLAPGLPTTIVTRGLQTFAFFGADVFVPRLVHDVRGASYALTGFAVTGGTLAWTVAAWVAAHRIARFGARPLITGGFAVIALGNGLLIVGASSSIPVAVAIVAVSVAGFGMGLGYSPVSVTMLDQAEEGREGEAGSALSVTDALAMALGTGLGGALVHLADTRGWSNASGVQLACAMSLLVAFVGIFVSRRQPLPRHRRAKWSTSTR